MVQTEHTCHFLHITIIIIYHYTVYCHGVLFHPVYALTGEILLQEYTER